MTLLLSGAAAGEELQGTGLADALRSLQARGLQIIFSDAVVTPAMTVQREPEAENPRAVLEEILRPHGLGVQEGPGGQLVVVRLRGDLKTGEMRPSEQQVRFESNFVFLNEIIVTPSHFRIEQQQPEGRVFLSKDDMDRLPHVGDDLYRAAKRLPGTAAGDISATFNVRGGEQGELLVILDGLELLEPFHLKDFQSVFSTVDSESVGGMDFLTGGFPVEYGDRMSGVMDITTVVPEGPTRTSLTLGTLNGRVLSLGRFNADRGSWLVNARAWYPAAVFDMTVGTADEIQTDYYDLLAKIGWEIGSHSTLSGNILAAYDDLSYTTVDVEEIESVGARYRSIQLWVNLLTSWSSRLHSRTVASHGWGDRWRAGGFIDLEEGSLDIHDRRDFDTSAFKQDWTLEVGDRHYLKWGFDIRRQHASYEYTRDEVVLDPDDPASPPETSRTAVELGPTGSSHSAYLADRFRLSDSFVAELGVRWDRQFYVGDHQISPRLHMMYMVSPSTTVRASWGRFHQSQRLNELQVEDGVTEFHPAQLADHLLASVEHRFKGGLTLRFEVYDKRLEDLRSRFENLFNPLELFPEAGEDRVLVEPDSGRSQGVEVLVRSASDRRLNWWASYALARSEDRIEGVWEPRNWDQRHALNAGLSWELPRRWNLDLAATYHSGWPVTPVTAEWDDEEEEPEFVPGPRNSSRFPAYFRLDARATKTFQFQRSELQIILEVLNSSNRKNVCCIDDFHVVENPDNSLRTVPEERYWAPIVPSVAVSWSF